jgi:hypothetical protein
VDYVTLSEGMEDMEGMEGMSLSRRVGRISLWVEYILDNFHSYAERFIYL